jgi:hypothetical protein
MSQNERTSIAESTPSPKDEDRSSFRKVAFFSMSDDKQSPETQQS